MGYSTDFSGTLNFNKQLTLDEYNFLGEFSEERRDVTVGGKPLSGYCQWVPTKDGHGLEWNGGEKFYSYIEWLKYLLDTFFEPKGFKVNGTIKWQGEELGDSGVIIVADNKMQVVENTLDESEVKAYILSFAEMYKVKSGEDFLKLSDRGLEKTQAEFVDKCLKLAGVR